MKIIITDHLTETPFPSYNFNDFHENGHYSTQTVSVSRVTNVISVAGNET